MSASVEQLGPYRIEETDGGNCEQSVSGGRASYPCHRAAAVVVTAKARTPMRLCKPHLAGLRRSVAHSERVDERIRQKNEVEARAATEASELQTMLGSEVEPYYRGFERGYDPKRVVVKASALRRLLEER